MNLFDFKLIAEPIFPCPECDRDLKIKAIFDDWKFCPFCGAALKKDEGRAVEFLG